MDATTYVLARYSTDVYAEPLPGRSIGKNIKAAREAAGIKTQGELARKLGVPQPQLSDWENDRYGTPDVKTLLRIAAAVPCALDALLQGVDAEYDARIDLLGHGRTGQSGSHQPGGADVPAEARIRELLARAEKAEQERNAYKGIVDHAAELVAQLHTVVRSKGRAAARTRPARGGRH